METSERQTPPEMLMRASGPAAPALAGWMLRTGVVAMLASLAALAMVGNDAAAHPFRLLLLAGSATIAAAGALIVRARVRAAASDIAHFALVAAQVGLIALALRQFQIHSPVFVDRIVPLVFFGFLMHHALPARLRPTCFLALGCAAGAVVFGVEGLWIAGIGLGLIGLCHLPVPFWTRIALVIGAATGLALLRTDLLPAPWSSAIWPVLGSMFMFRLIIYLYDLRHASKRPPASSSLSYFFLLPNVAFPLFPVIDFGRFTKTYYDQPALRIYQQGVHWLLLGLVHLLIYRFIYQRLTILPTEVTSLPTLAYYAITNFLLYFQVSGQFHLIVGILHLFGFHLPRAYHYFPLASSFTDLWRRNNIYWKDFMQKVVYYPVFFRLRGIGQSRALVFATVAVVFVTWFLHSFQWLWILGRPLFAATDIAFWSILGVGMIVNSLHEMKVSKKKALGREVWGLRDSVARAWRTVAFFCAFSLLWALWSSPTMGDWFGMLAAVRVTVVDVALVAAVALLAIAAFVAVHWLVSNGGTVVGKLAGVRAGRWSMLAHATAIMALWAIGNPAVAEHAGTRARVLLQDLHMQGLNKRDAAQLQRGYYENIAGVNRVGSQLWELYARRPDDWPVIGESEAAIPRTDLLELELRPLAAIFFHGQPFRVNRWGMRDQDYERTPAAGVQRVAVLGSSYVMGSGVADDETFENIVERRINRETPQARLELLNFAVGGYSPIHQLMILEERVFPFQPGHVLLVGHHRDAERIGVTIVKTVRRGGAIPLDFVNGIVAEAAIDASTPELAAIRLIEQHQDSILAWAHRRIVELCRERGITPVWVYAGMPGAEAPDSTIHRLAADAGNAGFETFSIAPAYGAEPPDSLVVAPWDGHPNARGHELLAARLHAELRANAHRIRLILGNAAEPTVASGVSN